MTLSEELANEKYLTTVAVYASHTRDFLRQWTDDHSDFPLTLMMTGGGLSFLDIGKLPGASAVLASAHVPYHQLDAVAYSNFGLEEGEVNPLTTGIAFCSPEATEAYSVALERRSMPIPNAVQVVVNASVTTSRWRRGVNEAWIWIRNHPSISDGTVMRRRFDVGKLTEEQYALLDEKQVMRRRMVEDMQIAAAVMSLLLNDDSYRLDIDRNAIEEVPNVVVA